MDDGQCWDNHQRVVIIRGTHYAATLRAVCLAAGGCAGRSRSPVGRAELAVAVPAGQPTGDLAARQLRAAAANPTGMVYAVGAADGPAAVWATFSPDGRWAAVLRQPAGQGSDRGAQPGGQQPAWPATAFADTP